MISFTNYKLRFMPRREPARDLFTSIPTIEDAYDHFRDCQDDPAYNGLVMIDHDPATYVCKSCGKQQSYLTVIAYPAGLLPIMEEYELCVECASWTKMIEDPAMFVVKGDIYKVYLASEKKTGNTIQVFQNIKTRKFRRVPRVYYIGEVPEKWAVKFKAIYKHVRAEVI